MYKWKLVSSQTKTKALKLFTSQTFRATLENKYLAHGAKTGTQGISSLWHPGCNEKEWRCKRSSLSALSEGHQRRKRSESAAAPMVWACPLTPEELVLVEDVYWSQERQTASFFCVCRRTAQTQSCVSLLCVRARIRMYCIVGSVFVLVSALSGFPAKEWSAPSWAKGQM